MTGVHQPYLLKGYRFTLSFLLAGIAIIALVFAVVRFNRGAVRVMVTGFGEGVSEAEYRQVRADLQRWLAARGFRSADEPAWARVTAIASEEWHAGDRNGIVLYVRLRRLDQSFHAYVQFHKLKWPFESLNREKAACAALAAELNEWWVDWKAAHDFPE